MKNKIKAILFAGALMLAGVLTGSMTANAETPEIMYQGKDGGIEWSIDNLGKDTNNFGADKIMACESVNLVV